MTRHVTFERLEKPGRMSKNAVVVLTIALEPIERDGVIGMKTECNAARAMSLLNKQEEGRLELLVRAMGELLGDAALRSLLEQGE